MIPELFRDARFVVLDKPAGLAVHAGPRGGASVEDHFPVLSRRRDGPWLAHRLDADTAGCLVVALRRAALHEAQAAFAAGRVEKTYWAVVRGVPAQAEGVVDAPLARHSDARSGWRMRPDPAGARAVTAWRVAGRQGEATWLELRPRTGRTHQLRVHCALLGCPILGDPVYDPEHGDFVHGAATDRDVLRREPGRAAKPRGASLRGDRPRGDRAGPGTGPGEPPPASHLQGGPPRGKGGGLQLLARAIRLPLDPPLAAVAPVPAHMPRWLVEPAPLPALPMPHG